MITTLVFHALTTATNGMTAINYYCAMKYYSKLQLSLIIYYFLTKAVTLSLQVKS